MEGIQKYSTWVEVDLSVITNNIKLIKKEVPGEIMAVVKANGYGHGAIQVAKAALEGGATWCGLARFEEALELRNAGIDCPLLLFGWVPPQQIALAIINKISMTVWDQDQINLISKTAAEIQKKAHVHLKVDTGMGRLGSAPQETLQLAQQLVKTPQLLFEGLYTHFARADEPIEPTTNQQNEVLKEVLSEIRNHSIEPRYIHAANSAASLTFPSAHYQIVRFGIAMYGLHPSRECQLPQSYQPALQWKSVLSHVKTVPSKHGISYGHEYRTIRSERIGTIPIGYADGFRRTKGNQVLVNGKKVPVIGRVCMDQVMVQLDQVPQAKAGDEVVIIGKQENAAISADDLAEIWGTINYEVTCGIGARVPRIYNSS